MQRNHNYLEIYTNLIFDILKTVWLNHKNKEPH